MLIEPQEAQFPKKSCSNTQMADFFPMKTASFPSAMFVLTLTGYVM